MKLIANSFWGFLAKRPNKRQHKFITKTPDWLTMLADASNIIEDVDFKHKDVLQVYYTKNEEMELPAPNTNVVLASFVTAQGRLKLYSELQKLNDRILYIDLPNGKTKCIVKGITQNSLASVKLDHEKAC